VNLRGKVIPVVDLRLKFGMEEVETTELTCIIVVQTREVLFGVLVDRVSEVVDLATADVEETPDFGVDVDTGYIMGMGNAGDRVTILLDIDRVLADDELEALRAAERDAA
jgi:purine-binding chemotaxis protein CheW